MSAMILVRVNCPNEAMALRLAETLLDERLAACANISGPVRSIYRWQGDRHTALEFVVWLKTTTDAADRLRARAAELHSDRAPAIIALDCADADPAYLDWLGQEVVGCP